MAVAALGRDELDQIDAYWRAANFLGGSDLLVTGSRGATTTHRSALR